MDALDAEGIGLDVVGDPNQKQGKDAEEGKDNPDAKPKRVVLRVPKFKAEHLQSKTRGIPALLRAFEKVKFNGKEEHELAKAMRIYRMWAHSMFKFATFDELCQKMEKEGGTFAIKTYMQDLRDERDDPTLKAQREANENRQDIMIDGDDESAIADAMRQARTPAKDRDKPRAPAISMIDDDEEDAPMDMQFEDIEPSPPTKQGGPDIDFKMSPSLEQHMPHVQSQRSAPAAPKPARVSTLNEDQRARMRANLQRAKRLKAERMRKKRELEAMASGKKFNSSNDGENSSTSSNTSNEEPQKKKARTSQDTSSSPSVPNTTGEAASDADAPDNSSSAARSTSGSKTKENLTEPTKENGHSQKPSVDDDDDMMELSDREESTANNEDAAEVDVGNNEGVNVDAGNESSRETPNEDADAGVEDADEDVLDMEASEKPRQYGPDEIPPSPPTFSQIADATPDDMLSATQVRASLQSQEDDALTPTQVLSLDSQTKSQGEAMSSQPATDESYR